MDYRVDHGANSIRYSPRNWDYGLFLYPVLEEASSWAGMVGCQVAMGCLSDYFAYFF
jgi:hypothetical protein